MDVLNENEMKNVFVAMWRVRQRHTKSRTGTTQMTVGTEKNE